MALLRKPAEMKVIKLQKHSRPGWPGAHKKPWGLGQVELGVGVGLRQSQPPPTRP